MAGIDVKMGVSGVSQFKSAMTQSSQSVKTLEAALKLNEKQLQATGDKEAYMAQKSKLLQQQIAQQTNVVKQGQAALQAMEKSGVDPASNAYQKLQQQVLNAQTALLGMQTNLGAVGQSEQQTAQQTDKLTNSLNSINKKVSFDAVLNGIGKITDGMEKAAKKIASLATDVWNTMTAAASWGDNENTLAAMYGIDVETLQKMQGASRTIDTSVETIIKSRQKLKQNMASGSDVFEQLGVSIGQISGKGNEIQQMRDWEDVFWDVGDALLHYSGAIDRDVLAQEIFGKSWMELMPLFKAGREEYEKTLNEQDIVTEENVNKLNQLDDAIQKLDQNYQALKNTFLAELAPAFTTISDALSSVLHNVNEYLQTDEGKEKMEALGKAVEDLFSGIQDIDAGSALDTAKGILDSITGSLDWIGKNKDSVVTAIKAIGAAFVALKAAEAMTTMAQMASSLKGLMGGESGKAAAGGETVAKSGGWWSSIKNWFGGGSGKAASGAETVAKTGGWLSTLGASLKGELGNVGAVLPFAAIPAVAIDSVVSEVNMQLEDNRKAAEERERLKTVEAQMSASGVMQNAGYAELWALMNSPYTEGNTNPFAAMPERYRAWLYDDAEDAMMDVMADIFSDQGGPMDALWDQWAGLMEQYLNGENVYDLDSVAQLWESMRTAIEQAGAENKISVPAELNPDLAGLQEQLNGETLYIQVVPYTGTELDTSMFNIDGSHANGLPFVPFDGYIAALHRGERVVPANQNRNYTTNSNLYVDRMIMQNGADADGLAARIAERTRHAMAGFGG